jgi:hypothetical protein
MAQRLHAIIKANAPELTGTEEARIGALVKRAVG